MAIEWKGQLAYKDPSGNVWNIGINQHDMWIAKSEVGAADNEFIDELLEAIDEMARITFEMDVAPSENIQTEELDRGAFPNEYPGTTAG